MGVARKVGQHGLWSGEGLFGVDDPVDFAQRLQECAEGCTIFKLGMVAEELQHPGVVQPGQPIQDEVPVEAGQDPDGQKEIPAAGDPLCAVRRQTSARNNHMDMWMVCHRRAPGVKHGCDPDARTEVLWVGGDLDHGVGARAHQQVVDRALVLVGDVSDRLGQCEDQMEVSHRQQFSLTCCQPNFCCTRLALGAMAIAARIIRNVLVGAVFTARYMATEHRRAATLDNLTTSPARIPQP